MVDDTWSDAEIVSLGSIWVDFGKWQYSFIDCYDFGGDPGYTEAKIKTNDDGSYFGAYNFF